MNDRRRRSTLLLVASMLLVAAGIAIWWISRTPPLTTAALVEEVPSIAGARTPARDIGSRRLSATAAPIVASNPHDTTAPPARGASLAQSYAALKTRADAGDAEAASQLYHDVQKCATAAQRLRDLPRRLQRMQRIDPSTMSPDASAAFEQTRRQTQDELSRARESSADCEELSERQREVAPLMLRAAQLGDLDATTCYVSGQQMMAQNVIDHPEWLTDYRDHAPALAQAALVRGDWNMVRQLRMAYEEGILPSLLGQAIGSNPALAYRYQRLERLGEPNGRRQTRLDAELADAARALSAGEISMADAWAQDAYERYFNATPSTDRGRGCLD